MTEKAPLLSVGEIKILLSQYADDYTIDFGANYLVTLKDNGFKVLLCEWTDKATHDAFIKAKEQEEAYKYASENSLPLEQCRLDKRILRLLAAAGIYTIYQLAYNTPEEIMQIKGLGIKAISQLDVELRKHGWLFGGFLLENLEQP